MFKTKWQKKYEQAVKQIEFWKKYHEEQMKACSDNQYLLEIYTAQKVALDDVLKDMKKIAEG